MMSYVGYMSRGGHIKAEHRYAHSVTLPVHPDQVGTRDPRRVWMYDCMPNSKTSVENSTIGGFGSYLVPTHRIYRFDSESDATMFILRWGGNDEGPR